MIPTPSCQVTTVPLSVVGERAWCDVSLHFLRIRWCRSTRSAREGSVHPRRVCVPVFGGAECCPCRTCPLRLKRLKASPSSLTLGLGDQCMAVRGMLSPLREWYSFPFSSVKSCFTYFGAFWWGVYTRAVWKTSSHRRFRFPCYVAGNFPDGPRVY